MRAYRAGTLGLEPDEAGRLRPPVRTRVLVPTRRRSLLALLQAPPRAYGWCRTRGSGATLAATFQAKRGLTVSAETMRRWLHEVGWVWKRAKLVANDDDPLEVMTPGTHDKHDLAGALEPATGTPHHGVGPRNTNGRFRDLLQTLEAAYPAAHCQRISVVVDHEKIHQAKAAQEWLATHPRIRLLFWPPYCPRANPIERAFGDVHDLCTRNHTRQRWQDLVAEVVEPLKANGPWRDKRSDVYNDPAVTAAGERMIMENTVAVAD